MPKINESAAKEQLIALLLPVAHNKDELPALVNKLTTKQLTTLLDGFITAIEDVHWANTGAQQTINATLKFTVVPANGKGD
jgi:hypothetical protein